ncbi:DsbA family oxidoreductase [Corynebacterium callunae]
MTTPAPVAKKMKIEVWSDIMCPFCYIGKKRLDDALAEFEHNDRVEVEYKSFELMPGLETYPLRSDVEMLAETKGMPVEQAKQMNARVQEMAHSAGLEMNHDDTVAANTINAHRLTHFAKEQGKQVEVAQALFKAHFVEGHNVDDIDELVAIAEATGLDGTKTREVLESDAYTNEVQQDVFEARQLGVQGVPFFVFDRKYAISGAQQSEVFADTVEKSFAEWAEANPQSPFEVIQGDSCSIDGNCS